MDDLVQSFASIVIGEPATLIYSSATVWLFALASGFFVASKVACEDSDWAGMTTHLPEGVTYDPGASEFHGNVELLYIPVASAMVREIRAS